MGDRKRSRAQLEKLIEMAGELKKREKALNQESAQLEQLRSSLDEREGRLTPAAAIPQRETSEPLLKPQPLVYPPQEPAAKPQPSVETQAPQPAPSAAQTVAELNEILKSIFWDYSNSVHLISTQMSTVTAAMMCAAVTCVLENKGFNARDVFFEEMEKMLKGGGLGGVSAAAPPYSGPRAVDIPAARPVAVPEMPDLIKENENAESSAVETVAEPAQSQPDDGILRIATVAEFLKLGEYGFRNDETVTRVALPEGIEQLPGSFFYGCRGLEEVWLPDSLKEIGPYAFYGCEKLHTVNLNETAGLREIGEYAFAMCSALQRFSVPAKVEVLGTSVFRFCSSLEKLSFVKGGSLRAIGSHLLQNCSSLLKQRLPDQITIIPTSMFYGCSMLKKVVAKGVDTIEDYAFYGNESLRTVRIRAKKAIAPQAFEGCDPALEIEYLNY